MFRNSHKNQFVIGAFMPHFYIFEKEPTFIGMEFQEYLKERYRDIQARSFLTKLELFLLDRVIRLSHIREITPEEFKRFEITDHHIKQYSDAWRLKETEKYIEGSMIIQQVDMIIEQWYKEENELMKELFRQYKALFITEYFPFIEFESLFPHNSKERTCHYCNISDYEVKHMRDKRKIFSKRNRGYFMEIDRIEPNKEYSKDNCVLACYWCNNAKTDEFSSDEFLEHIGPGIQSVWKERNSKG